MLKLAFAVLLLIPTVTFGATIYVDGTLGANCSAGNYSIQNRSCSGSNGNAYNNIQGAISATASGDTITIRGGTYTSNAASSEGIVVKAGQTWQGYPGESATIKAASTHNRVMLVEAVDNVTVKNLTLIGGKFDGIRANQTINTKLLHLDISGYNTSNEDYSHGIMTAPWPNGKPSQNIEISDSYVHDAAGTTGSSAGIAVGGQSSNFLIQRNRVENTSMGIWLDVDSGNPDLGFIPHAVKDTVVKNIAHYCYHLEARSSWKLERNVCDGAQAGILVRPGGTMKNLAISNNTIYNVSRTALWLQNEGTSSTLINSSIDNNIFFSANNQYSLMIVGANITVQNSNIYRNNLFYSSANALGICWGNTNITWYTCDGGAQYADTATSINQFNSNVGPAQTNIAGDPLLANPASGDFRLCEGPGNPVTTCVGRSPAIDAGVDVGLSYYGGAPDLGAIESGGTDSVVLPPPKNLRVNP